MLHIADGESVANTLRQSGVAGDVKIYGDLMYEGPTPAGITTEAWVDCRASFLSQHSWVSFEEARCYLTAFEETLRSVSGQEETILWLDHRLSDQLILIRLLDWFSRYYADRVKLGLICIGSYPGVDRFVGLGQLRAEQLLPLADTGLPVSEAQFRAAQSAWNAFTSPDPTAIEAVIGGDTSALPFLASALRRHLEQFPSVINGLSRTERQALSVLRERGPLSPLRLFFAVQAMENPLFMGNLSFFRILKDLASAQHPLIHTTDGSQLRLDRGAPTFETILPVEISEVGLSVLDGRADHVRLNGIDRWLGGVHLKGAAATWRWSPERQCLVRIEESTTPSLTN
ncbi:MAG: hypothetical protein WAM39_14920 [Bryobacteraceae bacterium]